MERCEIDMATGVMPYFSYLPDNWGGSIELTRNLRQSIQCTDVQGKAAVIVKSI